MGVGSLGEATVLKSLPGSVLKTAPASALPPEKWAAASRRGALPPSPLTNRVKPENTTATIAVIANVLESQGRLARLLRAHMPRPAPGRDALEVTPNACEHVLYIL